ncbi:MAG: hypothetical protein NUV93_05345, partial [Firmicutes bacterium]|nr:hypothetical protein [Bacillota bacterium]
MDRKKIVIQKFGGTSVATPGYRDMVADKVVRAVNEGYTPVVVVSAMGRDGDPYATGVYPSFTARTTLSATI